MSVIEPPIVIVVIRGGTDPTTCQELVDWFLENFAVQFQGFDSTIDENVWAAFTGNFSVLNQISEKDNEIASTFPCIAFIGAFM